MENRQIQLPTGPTIDFVERGDALNIAVLMVHAVADSRRIFEPLLDHLPAELRVVIPSQRGHGDSSSPDRGYRPEDFAADLEAFMDALGIERAVVVGGSSGGVVARRFAIDHPHRVLGLVFLGSPFRLHDKPGVAQMWKTTFEPMTDPVDEQLVRGFGDQTIGEVVPVDLFEMLVAESLKPSARVWKGTMRGLLDDTSDTELDRITAPTLVMWGGRDELLSREDQQALVDAIAGTELIVFEDGGHMFYLEDPKRTAAELMAFIDRIRT